MTYTPSSPEEEAAVLKVVGEIEYRVAKAFLAAKDANDGADKMFAALLNLESVPSHSVLAAVARSLVAGVETIKKGESGV